MRIFDTIEKKLVIAIGTALWLLILLWLALRLLGGSIPTIPMSNNKSGSAGNLLTVRDIDEQYSLGLYRNIKPAVNLQNPFYPNPKQPLPAPVAPVTSKSIEVAYLGFFATSRGDKTAYLQLGDQTFMGTNGAKFLGNFKISEIGINSLTLLDGNGKPVTVEFRGKKTIEIPTQ